MSAAETLTKIIATVGPASRSPDTLDALVRAGVSTFRLNLSHGSLAEHADTVREIRASEARTGKVVAILADLPGPKIRVAGAPPEGIPLEAGHLVRLCHGDRCQTRGDAARGEWTLACTYAGIVDDAEPGHRILIDDGAIRLLVVERHAGELIATTLVGGLVKPSKGVNLPDSVVRADPITARDRDGARFAVEHDADFVAMSFVQDADDVRRLQEMLDRLHAEVGPPTRSVRPRVIAKIERPQAVERIASIVDVADGVMVARGDLGVEMDLAKVPVVQKRILAIARAEGKPAIVATQMLQSMVDAPVPTRAEASDVANAILDGCDAVMLSGETAVGKWPVIVVETMARIAREAEALAAPMVGMGAPPNRLVRERNRVAALAHGAMRAARDLNVAAIVAWTSSGTTALLLSRYGFTVPIRAASTSLPALRSTRLLRGVEPLYLPTVPASFGEFLDTVESMLVADGRVRMGDLCIVVTGESFDASAVQASITIREIGTGPVFASPPSRGGGR
ncbi:MAG: pyruvate kinase [Phycisphaerae bacterium]|nr:pyruvate kinase [Phycisphaerae bacterium]